VAWRRIEEKIGKIGVAASEMAWRSREQSIENRPISRGIAAWRHQSGIKSVAWRGGMPQQHGAWRKRIKSNSIIIASA